MRWSIDTARVNGVRDKLWNVKNQGSNSAAPPGSSTRQVYPAASPGSSTWQLYPAALPGSSTRQLHPTALPSSFTQQLHFGILTMMVKMS